MQVDGVSVIPGTARFFSAIGGGYGIKMKMHGSEGDEFLFGTCDTREAAKRSVEEINIARLEDDACLDSRDYCPRYIGENE